MTTEQISDLRNYINFAVRNFDARYDVALDKMDNYRCSLQHADYELYREIEDAANEWAEDENVTPDEIYNIIEQYYN